MAQNYYAELYYHFVWATKGRLPLLTDEIEKPVWTAITSKCRELGAFPIVIGGIEVGAKEQAAVCLLLAVTLCII